MNLARISYIVYQIFIFNSSHSVDVFVDDIIMVENEENNKSIYVNI